VSKAQNDGLVFFGFSHWQACGKNEEKVLQPTGSADGARELS